MSKRVLTMACAAALLLSASAGAAEEFQPITEEGEFVSLIENRELKRFAIKLRVTPDGQIVGQGFGREVTGDWDWRDGYFCRDLFWGDMELGYNCQQVKRNGTTLRFIENQGQGRSADLRLD